MPTRKVRDIKEFRPCTHPEHNPPTMMVFEPGEYEHECPSCGHISHFVIQGKYYTMTSPRHCHQMPECDCETCHV